MIAAAALGSRSRPMLDALDISAPNMRIGAGIVLGVCSLVRVVAAAAAAAVLAWSGADRIVGRRSWRALSATIGIVTGIAMIVDGAFAV